MKGQYRSRNLRHAVNEIKSRKVIGLDVVPVEGLIKEVFNCINMVSETVEQMFRHGAVLLDFLGVFSAPACRKGKVTIINEVTREVSLFVESGW